MVVFSMVQYPNISSHNLLALAKEAGAAGIEWDDAAHLHPGHTHEATQAYWDAVQTKLEPVSLVSTYTLGNKRDIQELFMPVIDCAFALHTSVVRLNPFAMPSAEADYSVFNVSAQELRTICDMANVFDMEIHINCRPGTLTDTPEGVQRLIKMANCRNCKCSWRPDPSVSDQENLKNLQLLKEYLGSAVINASWKKEYGTYLENTLPNVPVILEQGRIS